MTNAAQTDKKTVTELFNANPTLAQRMEEAYARLTFVQSKIEKELHCNTFSFIYNEEDATGVRCLAFNRVNSRSGVVTFLMMAITKQIMAATKTIAVNPDETNLQFLKSLIEIRQFIVNTFEIPETMFQIQEDQPRKPQ